jgi:hypothetical protein
MRILIKVLIILILIGVVQFTWALPVGTQAPAFSIIEYDWHNKVVADTVTSFDLLGRAVALIFGSYC